MYRIFYCGFSTCKKLSTFGKMPCKSSNPPDHQFECHMAAAVTTKALPLQTLPPSTVLVVVPQLKCVEIALCQSNTWGNAIVAPKDSNQNAKRTSYTDIIYDNFVDIS